MFLLSANHVALYAESDVGDKVGCHQIPGHKFRTRMIGPFLFHIPILSLFHRQNFFLFIRQHADYSKYSGGRKKAPREKNWKKYKYCKNKQSNGNTKL